MATKAFAVTVRRIATGCDYHMRLFALDAETACTRAKDRARRELGMTPARYREIEAGGVAVFRVVTCAPSADQSRPSEV